jgi:hypothetical protein
MREVVESLLPEGISVDREYGSPRTLWGLPQGKPMGGKVARFRYTTFCGMPKQNHSILWFGWRCSEFFKNRGVAKLGPCSNAKTFLGWGGQE